MGASLEEQNRAALLEGIVYALKLAMNNGVILWCIEHRQPATFCRCTNVATVGQRSVEEVAEWFSR